MRFLEKLRIKSQLSIIALSTIFVMLAIILLTYLQISKVIYEKNREYTVNIISQITETVASNIDMVNQIATNTANSIMVRDLINAGDSYNEYIASTKVDNFLTNIKLINKNVLDIAIVGKDGIVYDMIGKGDQIKNILYDVPAMSIYYTGLFELNLGKSIFKCIAAQTNIYSNSGDEIGVVVVVMKLEGIGAEIEKALKASETKFYLLDRDNLVFSSNDQEQAGEVFDAFSLDGYFPDGDTNLMVHGKKSVVQMKSIAAMNGKIISVIPEKELFSDVNKIGTYILVLFLFAIGLLAFPFFLVIHNILTPLKRLMQFMNEIKTGNLKNLKRKIGLRGNFEVGSIANEFNSMLDEINGLTHRLLTTNTKLYEIELEKKQSELAFLQSQINPHFLYNTLESIINIAYVRGVPEIMEIAKALGRIFRYSIKGPDIVFLKDELEIVRFYVRIQQIRFAGRFEVFYDFPEELLMCKIPKMILQPIVENAVCHGIEPLECNGVLRLKGEADENGELMIRVIDNGTGMEKSTLEFLQACLSSEAGAKSCSADDNKSIGISNVNNRIKLIFGRGYGVYIRSEQGKGTEVVLKLSVKGRNCDV